MTADIISLDSRRKPPDKPPTIEELATYCVDSLADNWARFARNNRLNEYFLSTVPSWIDNSVNYLADINALSAVESKINLTPIVFGPGTDDAAALGWVAATRINGVVIRTPVMMCEAYARCFNIMLYLKLARELVKRNIRIE